MRGDTKARIAGVLRPDDDDLWIVGADRRLGTLRQHGAKLSLLASRQRDLLRTCWNGVLRAVFSGQRERERVRPGGEVRELRGTRLLCGSGARARRPRDIDLHVPEQRLPILTDDDYLERCGRVNTCSAGAGIARGERHLVSRARVRRFLELELLFRIGELHRHLVVAWRESGEDRDA